jgi:hypothetical protein
MEGVRIFTPEQLKAQNKTPEEFVAAEMKDALEGMISAVFGKVQVRYARVSLVVRCRPVGRVCAHVLCVCACALPT